jgi:exosortase
MPTAPLPAPRVSWAAALLVAVPLAAHLPLLAKHAGVLWIRPHYQFFPAVLLGALVLAVVRLRSGGGYAPGRAWAAALGLCASWALLAAGVLLDSPWLAAVSALVLLPAVAYAVGGGAACRRLWPTWVMLCLVVPPPFELDRALILWLQAVTTRWASQVLDVFRVYHAVSGNVIEVDGRSLFVDQACSGVNSLFSLVACTLFLVFLTGRGPVRGVALLVAAFGWVLVANVARVVGIVLLAAWSGIDVSGGWRHEVFGLVVFGLAVGLLVSTDQFLAFLSAKSDPVAAPEPPAAAPEPRAGAVGRLAAGAVPAFLALMAFHLAQPGSVSLGAKAPRPDVRADLLPAALGGWERQDFRTHAREVGSFFGDFSDMWTYRRGDRSVLVSLDHPFPGWHDLTRCYTGQGWQVQTQGVVPEAGGFLEVRMEKPASRAGYLVVAQFDRTGRPLRPRPGGAELAADRLGANVTRLRHRLGLAAAVVEADPPGPVYQFQVFAESYSPLSAEDAGGVRELFGGLLSSVRAGWSGSSGR